MSIRKFFANLILQVYRWSPLFPYFLWLWSLLIVQLQYFSYTCNYIAAPYNIMNSWWCTFVRIKLVFHWEKKSLEPDLNQRPVDYYTHCSLPLYQLNYQGMDIWGLVHYLWCTYDWWKLYIGRTIYLLPLVLVSHTCNWNHNAPIVIFIVIKMVLVCK